MLLIESSHLALLIQIQRAYRTYHVLIDRSGTVLVQGQPAGAVERVCGCSVYLLR